MHDVLMSSLVASSDPLFLFAWIADNPVEIISPLQHIRAFEHEYATFVCKLSCDSRNVTWLKDGSSLVASDKYYFANMGQVYTLTIKDVQSDDSAEYSLASGGKISTASLIVEGRFFV